MFSVALIVFREVFEIVLILSILIAATKGVKGRDFLIWNGLFLGVAGAILIAFFADAIATLANGMGQEVFNACILLLAAVLIIWTVIWLQLNGFQIANNLKSVGRSVATGKTSPYSLSFLVAAAVLREGSEIVLFTHGVLATGKSLFLVLAGGYLGLWAGVLIGLAMYYGLIQISIRSIFSLTSWLLIFLSAGMVSQAVGYLVKAGFLPAIISPAWDTSFFLPETHFPGNILHILLGYSDRPAGIQILCYLVTLTCVIFLFLQTQELSSAHQKEPKGI